MKERDFSCILVTGGAGFIGSNFIRYLLDTSPSSTHGFTGRIINLDALTYAGNPENLSDIEQQAGNRYHFVHGDITDDTLLERLFATEPIDAVVHFAAESHVDRSIDGPAKFVQTNVMGTLSLLQAVRRAWRSTDGVFRDNTLFHHISTDEVYGTLGPTGFFTEDTSYDPRSPYSASKAASDHLVMAYHHTYGMQLTLTNCSNNYGPYQFPEKIIPLTILNIIEDKPLPVYGDGRNIRDWLYVEDHNRAVWDVMRHGENGRCYNIGGENEWENIRLVETLCDIAAEKLDRDPAHVRRLIRFVKDRPGHDRRYAIDCSRIKRELGWTQTVDFAEGLNRTVQWYLDHRTWLDHVRTGAYRQEIENH